VVNIGTKVGNQIPDFTIVYEDGTEITSASLIANGKPVFMFFAATWCPSCTRELHELKEIYPEFSNDIEFITIGVDPTESIETLAQYKHQIGQPWPIAKPIGSMISDLKILSQSAKVAFNSNGIITYRDGYGKGNRTVWREWMENNGEGF
jgi:alkyl hydroperoxide reductase subunit AhpC